MLNLYIEGLGYRHPIKDKEQIMWYFEQVAQTKSKNHVTRFWLDLKERHCKFLLKVEAYELLAYLTSKSTAAQEKRRLQYRTKAKQKAAAEMENFKVWYDQLKLKNDLIAKICMN